MREVLVCSQMRSPVRLIAPSLVQSYRQAIYLIHDKGGDIAIKVGEVSHQLSTLMKAHKAKSAAFITAFNPYSALVSPQENELSHKALLSDLSALGLECISGEGVDSENLWPSEPSILILGISLENAESLAKRYKQNAFIWIPGDEGLAELKLLFPISPEGH